MGTGASAGVAAATNASSAEEIRAALNGLSDADRAKLRAALGDPADDKRVEQPLTDAPSKTDAVEVKAIALNGESLAVLKVPAGCTVGVLKQKIAEVAPDAAVEKQRVICGDKILADEVTVKCLQKDTAGTVEVQVVLKDPVELKCDDLSVMLTELTDGVGNFESFGFEVYSFFSKRQYGTYELREATDADKANWEDNAWTHSMTLRFSSELQRKKFPLTQEDIRVNMDNRTFLFYGEEE